MSQVSHSTDRSRARDEMRLTSEASMLALDASKWQVRLVSLRREPREAHVLFLEKKSLSRVERARQASWRASECDAHAKNAALQEALKSAIRSRVSLTPSAVERGAYAGAACPSRL